MDYLLLQDWLLAVAVNGRHHRQGFVTWPTRKDELQSRQHELSHTDSTGKLSALLPCEFLAHLACWPDDGHPDEVCAAERRTLNCDLNLLTLLTGDDTDMSAHPTDKVLDRTLRVFAYDAEADIRTVVIDVLLNLSA